MRITKKSVKYIINAVVILLLLLLAGYLILSEQDLPEIIEAMRQAKLEYLIIGIALLILYVACESFIIKYLMKNMGTDLRFHKCFKYSFVGFFFCAITPSATGGQPAQVVWMARDGVDAGLSSLILCIVTMVYKIALIIISGVLVLLNLPFVKAHIGYMGYVYIFSFILNLIFITALGLLIYKPAIAEKITIKCMNLLSRIRLIKNKDKIMSKVNGSIDKYKAGSGFIKSNFGVMVNVFFITVFQRMCFFAITYVVYRSFGLSGTSFLEIITLQTILTLSLDILPLPGGIGANEEGFLTMYDQIFTGNFLVSGLLFSRGINYYVLVVIGAAVTVISYITGSRRIALKNRQTMTIKEKGDRK
ncbi:MAG: lysylphosphatidylglycerol synthase transmembrane domain-containing protein [Clostridia bacterium]